MFKDIYSIFKTDHVQGHKASLNTFQKIGVSQNSFSYEVKLKRSNNNKANFKIYIEKLENAFPLNLWGKEEKLVDV